MGLFSVAFPLAALAVTAVLVASMLRQPALRRLGLRNLARRKGNTLLVVVGSMVGTALISGSLVLNDSTSQFQSEEARETLGEIDEVVRVSGQRLPSDRRPVPAFEESVVERLSPGRIEREVERRSGTEDEPLVGLRRSVGLLEETPGVDGSMGVVTGEAPARAVRGERASPAVTVVGVGWEDLRSFGGEAPPVAGLPAPGRGEAYVSEGMARALELREGERVRLRGVSGPVELRVAEVVPAEGISGYRSQFSPSEGTLMADPSVARRLLGVGRDEVNAVFVSNSGDLVGGLEGSEEVSGAMRALLEDEEGRFQVSEVKKDTLEGGGIRIGDVFLMISSFAILAGVLLIVNIYAMLAEERKGELGILRAVALKRGALVRTFVYEGYAYSLLASLLGTFVGLGVAYGLVRGINQASGEFADLFAIDLTIPFSARPESLVAALSAGLLVTFVAVLFASIRVGSLNVVSAIRDLPEPEPLRPRRILLVPPALLLLLGLGLLYAGYASRDDLPTEAGYLLLFGPVLALFGLGLLLSRAKPLARPAWTLVGAAVLLYAYFSNEIEAVAEANEASPAMFFFQGAFMVLGAVVVVSFNLGILYGTLRVLTRVVPPLAPVLRVAVAHPAARPGRTGFTLAMFALILYVVTVAAIFSATQDANLQRTRDEQLSGYDGAVQSGPVAPIEDFEGTVRENRTLREGIAGNTRLVAVGVELPEYKARDYTTETGPPIGAAAPDAGISEYVTYVPDAFLRNTTDVLASRSERYDTDREAWLALREDPDLAILTAPYNGEGVGVARPRLGAGDTLTLRDPLSGKRAEKEIIGRVKDPGGFPLQVVNGVILGREARDEFGDLPSQETYLLELQSGADEALLGRELKQAFAESGAQSFLLDDILGRIQRFQNTFVGIVQAFLGFGLVVGVAGLSVISARAVRERRREIGTLRAVGFKGRTVGWQFVVESSTIAVLGIALGVAVGALGGYNLFTYAIDDAEAVFVFPWRTMVPIGLGVWAASLLFTLAPAIQASRVPPVEALRYEG